MHFSFRETFLKKENLWIKMIESHDWKHTQENFPKIVGCGGLESLVHAPVQVCEEDAPAHFELLWLRCV